MHHSIKPISAILVIGTMILSGSCNLVSKEDEKGIKDVAAYFGGNCRYGKNINYSTGSGKEEFINMEISNSSVVEQYSDKPVLCTSNAAYIFYNDVGDEKKNINIIQVTLHYNDGSSVMHNYSNTQLDSVNLFMPIVKKAVRLLKERNFDSVYGMFSTDTNISKINKEAFIHNLKTCDSTMGGIKSFRLQGFKVSHSGFGSVIFYAGALFREKKDCQFAIAVLPGSKNGQINFLDYKY